MYGVKLSWVSGAMVPAVEQNSQNTTGGARWTGAVTGSRPATATVTGISPVDAMACAYTVAEPSGTVRAPDPGWFGSVEKTRLLGSWLVMVAVAPVGAWPLYGTICVWNPPGMAYPCTPMGDWTTMGYDPETLTCGELNV